ncbi:MAG: carbohydrate ABC transporter permease [Oscillospiraceae bacterium]|nr:carbohydrate ABC transporter permease [Oscillospiraceae bacterium]
MRIKKISPGRIILYMVLIIASAATLYPFLWMISASFLPLAEIVGGNMSLVSPNMSLDNYRFVLGLTSLFPRWFLNSFIVALVGTTINVIFNSMAGYSLARLTFPGRNKIYFGLLALIMVPGQVLLIPNYLIMNAMGMLDTFAAITLPAAVNIAYIFMMRQFFINFSTDVEEAASIDGLGRYARFFRISLPLARPAIATQSVFVFMGFWNEFVRPMLYLQTQENFTITLGLQTFSSRHAGTQWAQTMAAACITVLPIIIIYFVFNNFFLTGRRMDGEK